MKALFVAYQFETYTGASGFENVIVEDRDIPQDGSALADLERVVRDHHQKKPSSVGIRSVCVINMMALDRYLSQQERGEI